jgi:NAD(P)H-dependent flavin oxidoreductase YrpB (nitropropane dioxygenase family)
VEVPRYWALCATADFKGDLEYAALHAGESCGVVNEIKPAAQIVEDLVQEAEAVIHGLAATGGRASFAV